VVRILYTARPHARHAYTSSLYITPSLYYAFIPVCMIDCNIVPTITLLYIFCGLECTFRLWRVQCHHVCVILCPNNNVMYSNTTIIRDDILTRRWNAAEPIRGISDSVNIITFIPLGIPYLHIVQYIHTDWYPKFDKPTNARRLLYKLTLMFKSAGIGK